MYNQKVKQHSRSRLIKHAIKALTTERSTSVCVQRDHVRRIWEQQKETGRAKRFLPNDRIKIEDEIGKWELFHDSQVQWKKASDLRVCYLCGDNPMNDLGVLMENGVLCQNVWAIENDEEILKKALINVAQSNMKNIRLFKGDLLTCLKNFEGQFDIIYLDTCKTLPSRKGNTLKIIGSIFLYNKLTSPGALITNFSFAPEKEENEMDAIRFERNRFEHITEHYLRYRLMNTTRQDHEEILHKIPIEKSYGDYITFQVIDSAHLYIPAYRMLSGEKQSESLWDQIFKEKETLQTIEHHEYENAWMYHFSKTIENCNEGLCKNTWVSEIFPNRKSLNELKGCKLCTLILTNPFLKSDVQNVSDIKKYGNHYLLQKILETVTQIQELEQRQRMPFINLLLGSLYSQMAYPSFAVVNKSLRLKYTAKKRQMFSDVFIFDKCRYLYEQFPSVHFSEFAIKEKWQQMVFCMVADGLQKHIGDVYRDMKDASISAMFEDVPESAVSHCYIPDREVLDFEYFKKHGMRLEKEGNVAEAMDCYNACHELCPKDMTIYIMKALMHLKHGNLDWTLQDCEKALELDPSNDEVRKIAQKALEKLDPTVQRVKNILANV